METDQLIRTLAADNAHRARPVGFVLALALLAAAPVSLVMFFAALGVRPDVMTAMHNPFFDLKFLVTLALAISAIAVSLHLSRPEAVLRGWAWLLADPGRASRRRDRMRDDVAAAVADDDAIDRQQFAGLHDGYSAVVAAAAGGGADRPAPRRADPACARRRARRNVVGRIGGDAIRRTMHRQFAAVSWRPGTPSPRRWSPRSARWRDRGCSGFNARPLRPGELRKGRRQVCCPLRPPVLRSAACGGSAAPVAPLRAATVRRCPCWPQDRCDPIPTDRRAC